MASEHILKSKVSKILQRGFSRRGVSLDASGDKFWDIKHENDGIVLVDLNRDNDVPDVCMHLRGVVVDTKTKKVISYGFGYPKVLGPDDNSDYIRNDPNIVIRPGVEGIIIRMFRIRGVLYYTTYKTLQADETYRESFRRLLATNYNVGLEEFEDRVFPRATCNYSHMFQLVTRDFLKVTSLPHEDIYLINTECFGRGMIVQPPVNQKPVLDTNAAINYFTGVVAGQSEDQITYWNGREYISNDSPTQLGNFLVIEVYRMHENTRVLSHTVEIYSKPWETRASIVNSQDTLYASYIDLVHKLLGMYDDDSENILSAAQQQMLDYVNPLHTDEILGFKDKFISDNLKISNYAGRRRNREDQNQQLDQDLRAVLENIKSANNLDSPTELLEMIGPNSFYSLANQIELPTLQDEINRMIDDGEFYAQAPEDPLENLEDLEGPLENLKGQEVLQDFEELEEMYKQQIAESSNPVEIAELEGELEYARQRQVEFGGTPDQYLAYVRDVKWDIADTGVDEYTFPESKYQEPMLRDSHAIYDAAVNLDNLDPSLFTAQEYRSLGHVKRYSDQIKPEYVIEFFSPDSFLRTANALSNSRVDE